MSQYTLWQCDDGTFDICERGEVVYQNIPAPVARAFVEAPATLVAIQQVMSGASWSPDTLDEIARILRNAGYDLAEAQP